MATYRFSFPTMIHFGAGVRRQAGLHLKEKGLKKPLFVTDRGLGALPVCHEFLEELRSEGLGYASFSEIWGNPVKSQVLAGGAAYRKHGCDSLIGFGGGAALDVAKAIALLINHPGDLFDYEDDKPGARPFDQTIPYWIALPTTAGTGSEVGRSSVVSDDETHLKKIIFSPVLLAKAVFADPELSRELPAKMTAATGMDALTHCVEAFLAKGYHPLCDGIALEGFRLSAGALVRAVKEPKNLDARSDMLMASMMGAIAFQKGLGLTHSCAHALSTVADMHHGLANGVMLDHALRINAIPTAERFSRMAQTIGLRETGPENLLEWFGRLKAEVGIPRNLTEAGVPRDRLSKLVEVAVHDACHPSNPVPCTRETFLDVFSRAFG
ncbi:MAG: iron-containing alcohol dehydrogenase [Bdellovibrionota bacterium]